MARRGRPTKLNAKRQEQICEAIRRGNYLETAAAIAGIDKVTLHDWLRKGRDLRDRQPSSGKLPPHRQALVDFSLAVEKAQAEAEARDVAVIDQAGQDGQWQASAWRLERKFPDRWGRRIQVADADGGSIAQGIADAWAAALSHDAD